MPHPSSRARRPVWLFVSAAWLAPALLAVLKEYARGLVSGRPRLDFRVAAFEGGDWLLYSFLTPIVFWLARRYPLARDALARRVPLHAAAAVLLCAAWALAGSALSRALFGTTPYGGGTFNWFLTSLPFGVAVYFAIVGIEHGIFFFVQAQERETRAARLEAQLVEARMAALHAQLQPHFLLNSLNAVTVVVRDGDTATAVRVLERLGEMLRRVTRPGRPQEVPLSDELEFTRQYLDIETVRFSDRLRPSFAVDPAVLGAAVPELLLQPLVENALRHGLARRQGATLLQIEARRDGAELVLSVIDDGPGPVRPAEGIGLGATRRRLTTLYGDRARLELVATASGGAQASVRLPYRELEPAS
jgi:two-component system LytT family sensor kinase